MNDVTSDVQAEYDDLNQSQSNVNDIKENIAK